MTSGYRLASPMEDRLEERKLAAVLSITCIVCGKQFDGVARDVIAANTAHREAEHPGRVDRGQRARQAAAKAAPISYWSSRSALGEL